MKKTKRIIVTGAGGSAAHNFIESLRLSGEKFYIVGTDISKYHVELSGADVFYQMPRADNPRYIKKLNQLIEKEKIELVHPQPDIEVTKLSENRRKVKAKLYLPSKKAVEICQDKFRFNQAIAKAKVKTAKSFYVKDEKSLKVGFKKLKKDNEKIWIRAIRGAGSRAALPITKVEHAIGWINYWVDIRGMSWGDFMISEFLPGKEYAFQSIWKNGTLLMSQARERMAYLFGNIMPSGQTSTPSIARTVSNQLVNEAAYQAIKTVDSRANGIFCADIKENKFGEPCLTEVNAGRFFTTSNFFSKAGINMPYYYVKLAYGEKVDRSEFKKFNNIEPNVYWVRMVDMGYKLIKESEWKIREI